MQYIYFLVFFGEFLGAQFQDAVFLDGLVRGFKVLDKLERFGKSVFKIIKINGIIVMKFDMKLNNMDIADFDSNVSVIIFVKLIVSWSKPLLTIREVIMFVIVII